MQGACWCWNWCIYESVGQCAALPNAISTYFFGKTLWGNAIDLLNSARDLGYEVEYNQEGNVNSRPRAGAVFVQETIYLYGHPYGHRPSHRR